MVVSTTWFLYYFWPGEHQACTYIHSSSLLKLSDIQGFGRCSQCPSWTNFALCRAVSWFFDFFPHAWMWWPKNLIQFVSEARTVPYIDQKKRKEQTIKNSLELSVSFIKKRFHVSISYSPTTFVEYVFLQSRQVRCEALQRCRLGQLWGSYLDRAAGSVSGHCLSGLLKGLVLVGFHGVTWRIIPGQIQWPEAIWKGFSTYPRSLGTETSNDRHGGYEPSTSPGNDPPFP